MQLTKLNAYAASLHALSSIGVTAAFYINGKEANFDTNLYTYKITGLSEDDRSAELTYYRYVKITTKAIESLIATIFLITSLFHTFYATDGFGSGLYLKEIKKGFNRYRWLEYAITSTIMIFVLAIISGTRDFDTVYELCVLNAVLMSFGFFLEQTNNRQVQIAALSIGFIIVVAIFFTLLRNFYYRMDEVKKLNRKLPDWLNFVLLPMLFWWISFGIVATLNVMAKNRPDYDFARYERYYIYLSFLSKANMGYYLTFGVTRDQTDKN
jgi:hypothetical protein